MSKKFVKVLSSALCLTMLFASTTLFAGEPQCKLGLQSNKGLQGNPDGSISKGPKVVRYHFRTAPDVGPSGAVK